MSRTLLIDCAPRRPSDGVVVPVRLCFKGRTRANFQGVQWLSLVTSPPSFETAIGYDGRSFGASPSPQIGALGFALTEASRYAAGLVWKDALVTIQSAPWPMGDAAPADAAFTQLWTGRADLFSAGKGEANVTLFDAGQVLRTPLLVTRFGSSGLAALDSADAVKDRGTDTVVPRAWGQVLGVPGLLIDRTSNIWLFAGNPAASPVTSVQGFYDGGALFGAGVGRASLAALVANVPAAGTVDYCLNDSGLFAARPWTPPTFPFTCDFTAGSTTAADIGAAIVASRSALGLKAGAVAAFNAVQGAACGVYIDDAAITAAAALDRVFAGLGAFWKVTAAGAIDIRRIGIASPILTVPTHRRAAPERRGIILPTWRRTLGYARNNKVHSEGDIAAIVLAGDLAYADGTTVEALKPAQAGADVTALSVPTLVPPAATTINFDYTGTVIAGELPRPLRAVRKKGNTDVSTSTTWTISPASIATIAGDGTISITALPASSVLVITSDRDGIVLSASVAITRAVGAAPTGGGGGGGGGTSASTSSLGSVAVATRTQIGGPLTVKTGSGGQVACSASLAFNCAAASPAGSFGVLAIWEWRIVGGSFADIAAEVSETTASVIINEGGGFFSRDQVGAITCNQTKIGLAANTDYEVRLMARTPSGTKGRSFSGTIYASGS